MEDELRRCLIREESENFSIFNEDDRAEFIFQLFKSLVIGGPLCQVKIIMILGWPFQFTIFIAQFFIRKVCLNLTPRIPLEQIGVFLSLR